MTCPGTTYKTRLQCILSAAESLKRPAYVALCKAGKSPQNLGYEDDPTIPNLLLPLPSGIQPSLVEVGCSLEVAQSLSDAFMRSAHKIHAMYQSTYAETCKILFKEVTREPTRLSRRLERIGSAFEHQYEARIQAAEHLAIDRATKSQQAHRSIRSKPSFNQEFVPLLEKYFEYNAYPSAPDRVALARKSMMTPRQIEVWFQNHRNRAKKGSMPLRRLTSDPLPLTLHLESLKRTAPFITIPERERQIAKRTEILQGDSNNEVNSQVRADKLIFMKSRNLNCYTQDLNTPDQRKAIGFISVPPLHAFPMVYPPSCGYDPFPVNDRENRFATPIWRRKPAISRPTCAISSIDDLISDFATKLIIQGPQQRKSASPPSTVSEHSWFAAMTTFVSSAPHPALLRSPYSHNPMALGPFLGLPHIGATASCQPPRHSLGPPPMQLDSSDNSSLARRKIARLPRRSPRSVSLTCGDTRSAMPDAPSPPRFLSSSSRSSSFTPGTFSDKQPSSGSSSASSVVATPVSSPIFLPENLSFNVEQVLDTLRALKSSQDSIHFPLPSIFNPEVELASQTES